MSDLMSTCGVYKITNTVTGQCYIGVTGSVGERFAVHRAALRAKRHHSSDLQHDFDQYGENSFKFEVLEELPRLNKDLFREREDHWISQHPLTYNSGNHRGSQVYSNFESNEIDLDALETIQVGGQDYVSENTLAAHLGITPQSVRRYIKIGAFPNHIRSRFTDGWLILLSDLRTYLSKRKQSREIDLNPATLDTPDGEQFFNTQYVAEYLGLARSTAQKYALEHGIGQKVGTGRLFSTDDIARLKEICRNAPRRGRPKKSR